MVYDEFYHYPFYFIKFSYCSFMYLTVVRQSKFLTLSVHIITVQIETHHNRQNHAC